jgi:hypothetical protein
MITQANCKRRLSLRRVGVNAAVAGLAMTFGLLGVVAPSHAQTVLNFSLTIPGPQQRPPTASELKPRFTVSPHKNYNFNDVLRQVGGGATIPQWSHNDQTNTYTYTMVGADPHTAPSVSTTIPTPLIPVIVHFAPQSVVFDPTVADSCSPNKDGRVPNLLVQHSPIFTPTNYTVGNSTVGMTFLGKTQNTSAFQRANLWSLVKGKGYEVLLGLQTGLVLNVTINGAPNPQNVPCGKLGFIDINVWDPYLQETIFPQLAAFNVGPTTFPIFLFENVVMYDSSISNCCILGYHGSFSNPNYGGAQQTYGNAEFNTNKAFTNVHDVSALSHEVGEWMDDPSGVNPTPPWGHIGQVSGCQNNLEVGDPLSGKPLFAYLMPNGVTYHVQDLAFISWFDDQKSTDNTGVHKWYSFFGDFVKFAKEPCS